MVTAVQRTPAPTTLALTTLLSFVVALTSFALSWEYSPRIMLAVCIPSAFIFFVTSVMLGEILHQQWRRDGRPPFVELCIVAFWGVVAFAGWWLCADSADYLGIPEHKQLLARKARAFAIAFILVIASVLLFKLPEPGFYLGTVAGILLLIKYVSFSADYLVSDD